MGWLVETKVGLWFQKRFVFIGITFVGFIIFIVQLDELIIILEEFKLFFIVENLGN